MEYRFKVGAIITNSKHEILLLKEYSQEKKGYFLNIVKGTVDKDDITLKDALFREIFEESGIDSKNIISYDIFKEYIRQKSTYVSVLLTFIVYINDKGKKEVSNKNIMIDENIHEYIWLSLKEIYQISENEFIDIRIFNLFRDMFLCINNQFLDYPA